MNFGAFDFGSESVEKFGEFADGRRTNEAQVGR
jgi:hypothetical protein